VQHFAEVCAQLVLRNFWKSKYDLERFVLEKLEDRRGKWWFKKISQM